jgi:phage I-like protein
VPRAFRWDPARGVMLKVDWTRSGQRAVLGNDYGYFSPCFLTDGSTVAGLPKTGEIGSLVNEPAFRDIPPIAA